jgi:hypothetical protein
MARSSGANLSSAQSSGASLGSAQLVDEWLHGSVEWRVSELGAVG